MASLIDKLCERLSRPGPDNQAAPLAALLESFAASRTGAAYAQQPADVPAPLVWELDQTWGSLPRLVAAIMQRRLARCALYVTAHIPSADEAQDDLETFGENPADLLPAVEGHEALTDATSEIACERLRICRQLLEAPQEPRTLSASIQALMQPLPSTDFLRAHAFVLDTAARPGASRDLGPEALCQWLVDQGYNRVDQVDAVGDFAGRGGIVDIFPPGQDAPVRVEFFGDEIESLRFFDLDSQRSQKNIDRITLTGCRPPADTGEQVSLLSYLPPDAIIVLEEPAEITEVGRIFRERLDDPDRVFPVENILAAVNRFDRLHACRFGAGLSPRRLSLPAQSVQRFENQLIAGLDELADAAGRHDVFLFCENPAEKQRVVEILTTPDDHHPRTAPAPSSPAPPLPRASTRAAGDGVQETGDANAAPAEETTSCQRPPRRRQLPRRLHLPLGLVHHGFALPDADLIVIAHHEVFGQQHRRRVRRARSTQAIDSFADLEVNDLVVHVNHGIGRFKGIKTLTKNGRLQEFLALEYANRALVHVPAENIDLVHKYVGGFSGRPQLSKLGAPSWNRQKAKVAAAVEDLASTLLEMQAQRETTPGIAYPADTTWQREFEEAFPFQETDDQLTTAADIKRDMQRTRPMDRLLCGDVGYGKTELAMRAAFKAVEYGKQVAVLVPTTVLAEQHYRTFTGRMADFPFIIESLSRFKTARQARDIVERARRGRVDILIGTHRLLSKDVGFQDLGLLIIDEEQRFGVEHKERLKDFRATVDILTMTATPIPRTLHLALLGIRDISSLTTPPLDRRSIVTEVCAYDRGRIRQAVLRELNREGQVFYVHNRVNDIESVADGLRRLVPEARIVIGHGQMPKHQLEQRMLQFVRHAADILVCTTIIESGLDIPNANTIIIDNADIFGLAELHQLRGRVGRHKNRAYAYILLPEKRAVNPTAVKRLKAIEEYSQLGSGFRIAMRDLEIRGAGNILGFEQSGHIEAVGYELYCRLLGNAVQRLRGETIVAAPSAHLEFNLSTNIPRSYIGSDRQRLEVYRRLATCRSDADLQQLHADLNDLFGKPPRAVLDLLSLAEIRLLASRWPIKSIVERKPDLVFSLTDARAAEPLFAHAPGSVRVPDPQTVHIRLRENYFDTHATLFAVLRKFLSRPATN